MLFYFFTISIISEISQSNTLHIFSNTSVVTFPLLVSFAIEEELILDSSRSLDLVHPLSISNFHSLL